MYKINDLVVCRNDVMKVSDIVEKADMGYFYVLIPVNDESLKSYIPVDNEKKLIRDLITKEEVMNIINRMDSIPLITSSSKMIENEYRRLLNEGGFDNLIRIIKTTYLRNKERLDNKKKKGDKDYYYYNLAERYLCTEFSYVLNLSYDDTKKFIMEKVGKLK